MLRPAPAVLTRLWSPLSDPEWAALAPLLPRSRIHALRHRMNCILAVAAHGAPWVPSGAQGPFWPTLYRHYHRWARAGVWARLHQAAAAAAAPPGLRALADWAAALHRRAARIVGRTANKFLKNPGASPANPLPALPFPPARPLRHLAEFNGILPNSAELSAVEPALSACTPPPPPPQARGLQGPFGLWRGGSEDRRQCRRSPLHPHPVATLPARRQVAATGKGSGRHDASA